jgi:hypothetical protein
MANDGLYSIAVICLRWVADAEMAANLSVHLE